MKCAFEIFCVASLAFALLLSIGTNQLSPHKVTVSMAGKVWSERWVTNPEYVTFEYKTQVSSNGLQYIPVPKTNYYWRVWEIFK